MLVFELLSVVGGLALWLINPALVHADVAADAATGTRITMRQWISPLVVAILAATAVATVVLTGSDVGIVAALRDMGHQSSIGWVLAVWGAGSAVGGLVYGAMKRTLSAFWLLGLLGASTIPVALATDRLSIAILLFVSGLFCAPTITATIDHLSRIVPARVGRCSRPSRLILRQVSAPGWPRTSTAGWPSRRLVLVRHRGRWNAGSRRRAPSVS